jgi:integrase
MRRPHGVEVVTEEVFLARTALVLLGLIGKGKERDRRPTQDELDRLLKYLDRNNRPTMPVGRMVQFAIATAMRQEEICSITWKDIDVRKRIVVVRDRKDPSQRSATTRRCHSSAQRAWTLGRYGSGRNSLHRTPSAWFLTTGARLERRSGALAEI